MSKSKIIPLGALALLALSFLVIAIPRAFAANPTITFETTANCTGQAVNVVCGTSADAFGLINQFNPASFIGDGLIAVFYCNPGGSSPTFTINSVVDTLGDNWILAQTLVVGSNQFGTYTVFAFITNIVTNASPTFHITMNSSPNAFVCNEELYLASTGISLQTFGSNSALIFAGTGFSQTNVFTNSLATGYLSNGNLIPFNTPANTFSFEISFINFVGSESISFTQFNVNGIALALLKSGSLAATGFPQLQDRVYESFNTNSISQAYQVAWTVTTTVSGYHYGMGLLVLILNPFSTSQSTGVNTKNCFGSNCIVTGGGTTLDQTTTFSLKANSTYYYYGTTNKGGLIIQNLTTKVASYTNGGAGKSTDTIELSIYAMKTGTNITGFSLINNPFTRIFNINKSNIGTGQSNIWEHAGNINVNIPANTSYAISFITKFSGLKMYNTIAPSVSMLNSSEGTFTPTVWSPPFLLSQTNAAPFNIFLEFSGAQNPILTTITLTTITNTSCVAGSTCTNAVVTSWATSVSNINNLQGGNGGMAIEGNLIQYWPIWMLPILSIPFGIQGIMVGLLLGVLLSSLLGIIPLWAALMMSLGIIFILNRAR